MRKLFIVAVGLMLSFLHAGAQESDLSLVPYRKGDLWGYSDTTGKLVIKPKFTEAELFQGPLTMAKLDSYYCVVNRSGDVVYKSTQFTSVRDEGKMFLATKNSYTEQLFDVNARPLTKVYNRICGFNKYGYADVTSGYTNHGLIDRSLHEILTPQYRSVEFYGPAMVKVYEGDKGYRLLNLKTGSGTTSNYREIYPLHEGLFMVLSDKLCGFINADGKEVITPKYSKATPEGESLEKWYNESTYEDFKLDGFYEGLAVVADPATKKVGYINKNGALVIPCTFEKAYGFCHGRAWVKSGSRWGMINRDGRYVLQPAYKAPARLYAKELEALDCFHEGLIPVASDSLYGYVDSNGRVAIPFRFQRAYPFYQGLAAAYADDKMGFIDHTGNWVISPEYDGAEGVGQYRQDPFGDGYAIALKLNGGYVIIDRSGNQLMSMEFDRSGGVSFESGLGEATANGKRYIFSLKSGVLYAVPDDHQVSIYPPHLIYDYSDKCFINIRTGIRYCD